MNNSESEYESDNQNPRMNTNNVRSVEAVAVKLPPFWAPCPEAWFVQAEAQFNCKGISQDVTKYEYIVQALPLDVITKVLDILQSPPDHEKYRTLKNALIQRFSVIEEKKLEMLLSDTEMGDRRPSEFYRTMKILAGSTSSIGEDLIKKLWLRKLPTNINIALTTAGDRDTNDLLILADKIFDISRTQQISSAEIHNSSNELNFLKIVNRLENKIDNLEQQIKNLSFQHRNNYSNFRQRSRSRSNSRNHPSSSNSEMCWYHRKFGNKASKCIQPCKFKNDTSPKN